MGIAAAWTFTLDATGDARGCQVQRQSGHVHARHMQVIGRRSVERGTYDTVTRQTLQRFDLFAARTLQHSGIGLNALSNPGIDGAIAQRLVHSGCQFQSPLV